MTSTRGGEQQQPPAEPKTAVRATHPQYPRQRHSAASESTEEINMSGLSKAALNHLQLNGNTGKRSPDSICQPHAELEEPEHGKNLHFSTVQGDSFLLQTVNHSISSRAPRA